jgi:hypothetical protein
MQNSASFWGTEYVLGEMNEINAKTSSKAIKVQE